MSTQTGPDEVAGVWDTFRGSSTAVKAVLGGVFVNKVGGFLSIFLVLLLTSAGYSAGQAATALGVYGFGAVFGVLLGGALADRLGPRDSTVISMAGTAVLVAALLYLPNYPLLLAAVAVVGGAQQIYRPASATLLAELTPEHRQVMIFAMYRFALNLGTMAAPLIGFGLYHLGSENYDLLFWGEALIALAYGVVAYLTLPGRDRPTAPVADPTDTSTAATGSYREVLRDRRYVLYLIAIFFNGVVYIQYLSTLPLDVAAAGVDLFWYTFAVALNGFIVIAFELPLTKVSQRWPFRLTVGLVFSLIGIGMAVYGLPMGAAVIIVGTLVWTLGEIIGAPVVWSYPGMAGPPRLRGRYIGSFQFMYALGAALGPMIGGFLFVQFGHGVWPIIAVAGLVAAAFAVAAIRPEATSAATGAADPPEPPVPATADAPVPALHTDEKSSDA